MHTQINKLNFEGQNIYTGIDASAIFSFSLLKN